VNPDLLEQLRALMQQRPDATRAPVPQRQPVPTMRAQMPNAMPIAPRPSAAQQAVSVALEFVPGLAEGMGARRAVEEALAGRPGRAAVEGAATMAGAVPFLGDARGLMRKGVQAYHGSPFNFKKFLDAALLSGEGSMVRGAGHYLATALEEARKYKTGRGMIMVGDKAYTSDDIMRNVPEANEAYDAVRMLRRAAQQRNAERPLAINADPASKRIADLMHEDETYQRALELAEVDATRRSGDINRNFLSGMEPDNIKSIERILEMLRNRSVRESQGTLYDVNVQVNPQRFLNWNAPLEAQPKFTQRALANTTSPELREAVRQGDTGGQLLSRLESLIYGGNVSPLSFNKPPLSAQVKARDVLANEGIEFTRYTPYGGGSGTKRGQHFIVYDPERIRIQNIMAALGLMAGGSAMTTPPDVEEEQ
jgi:hypothetical protein